MRTPHRLARAGRPESGRSRAARLLPAAAGFALLLAAACDEATAPLGEPASVGVRVYLDRDGSGSFTVADSGLAGVALALVPTDGGAAPASATSDAAGLATFAAVAPGAYAVELPGTAPAGTVLASAPAPRVVVSAIGQVQASDVRYAWLPATIAGRIFRDDDGSGAFSAGDTPGAGLFAVLRRGAATVDSVIADVDGAFAFRFLAPGAYTVRLQNPGTISYTGGAERVITLSAGGSGAVSGIFTGALVIPVAEARARAVGSAVAVVGNLVVGPGRFTSGAGGVNSEIWVQDATGGIAAFSVPTADSAQYQRGDRLEISGTRGVFSAQAQISVTRVANLGAGTPVVPAAQSAAQARTLERDGQLVRVPNLTILSVPGGTGAAFTVIAADAADDTLQIRVAGLGTDLTRASFTVGNRYNVTGVLTRFNATPQIKIRDAGDLELGAAITPITTVRTTGTTGASFTIAGRITAPPAAFPSGSGFVNSEIWVQDASGGIAAFSVPTADTATLALGNTVEVTGAYSVFNGQAQLGSLTVVRTGNGSPVAPVSQTGAEISALTREGQLVSLGGFTVTAIGGGTGTSFNVDGTSGGVPVQVRVAGALRGLSRASFTVGSTYTITGILSQFRGTAQIKVRFATDVTP